MNDYLYVITNIVTKMVCHSLSFCKLVSWHVEESGMIFLSILPLSDFSMTYKWDKTKVLAN